MFEFLKPKKKTATTVPPSSSTTSTVTSTVTESKPSEEMVWTAKTIPVVTGEVPESVTTAASSESESEDGLTVTMSPDPDEEEIPERDEAREPDAISVPNGNVQVFSSEFGSVRVIVQDGEPWFVAADVCKALEHTNTSVAVSKLDEDERSKLNLGRQGEVIIVSEPGLYALVLGSRKPEAKAFKRWITHDVIPAIRRHGMYATPQTAERLLNDPDFAIKLFQQIKDERDKSARLESKNQELTAENELLVARVEMAEEHAHKNQAKAVFADSFDANTDCISFTEAAKRITDRGHYIKVKDLIQHLRDKGIIDKNNNPTFEEQASAKRRVVLVDVKCSSDGKVRSQPKVTQYGLRWLYFKLCGETYREKEFTDEVYQSEKAQRDEVLRANALKAQAGKMRRVSECAAVLQEILSGEHGDIKYMPTSEVVEEWRDKLGEYHPMVVGHAMTKIGIKKRRVSKAADGVRKQSYFYEFPAKKASAAKTDESITAMHTDAERKEICYNIVKMLLRENADNEPYWQYITLEAFKDNHPRLSPFTETEIYSALLKMNYTGRTILGTLTFRLPM